MSSQAEIERAKALLERLRVRTEARGATPAEAAAAAELVDKICRRYGLDKPSDDRSSCDRPGKAGQQLEEARCPGWVMNLALCVALRFRCECGYTWQIGERSTVIFTGEEHLASVAQWLFSAVYLDLRRRSHYAALAHDMKGPKRKHFRTVFCESASWEVVRRMRPPQKKPSMRELIVAQAAADAIKDKPSRKPPKPKELSADDLIACLVGQKAGRDVSIDTNAVGDRRGAGVALIGCGS